MPISLVRRATLYDIRPKRPIDGEEQREPAEERVGLGEQLLLPNRLFDLLESASTRPSAAGSDRSAAPLRESRPSRAGGIAAPSAPRTRRRPAASARYGTYIVGGASSRTLSYFDVAQHADDLELRRSSPMLDPKRWPIGFSFGKYFRAAASLMMTTFGAVSLSRSVKPRPATRGIAHHLEEVRRDDEAVDAVVAIAARAAYVRPCTKMLVELTLPESSAGCDIADGADAGHRRRAARACRGRASPDPRLVVAVQLRVDAEEDQVLRVEADVHVPQVVQRPQEQAGADEQHERDRDLHDEQRLARAGCATRRRCGSFP